MQTKKWKEELKEDESEQDDETNRIPKMKNYNREERTAAYFKANEEKNKLFLLNKTKKK